MTKDASPRRQMWIDLICLSLIGGFIAWSGASVMGTKRLKANALNDSVGYYAAARTFYRTHRIDSHIIYPSTLSQPTTKTYLYMPGYYCCLAISFLLFGTGVWPALLVSVISYLNATGATYMLGRLYYDRRVALLGAGLFMVFPANLCYLPTPMMELSIVSASILALCIFAHLPGRWMLRAGPALLAMPFLFRETSVFLILPMVVILMDRCRRDGVNLPGQLRRAGLFILASVLLLALIFLSPIASGRPSILKLDIFYSLGTRIGTVYRDAVAEAQLKPTASEWGRAIYSRFFENIRLLSRNLGKSGNLYPTSMIVPMLIAVPLALIRFGKKRDPLALGAALLIACTLFFVCLLYIGMSYHVVRLLMCAAPLVALLFANFWYDHLEPPIRRLPAEFRAWPTAGMIVIVGVICARQTAMGYGENLLFDRFDDYSESLIGKLHHDNKSTLVGPVRLCLPYTARHWPVKFSFVPANRQTLKLLCDRTRVTTLIHDRKDPMDLKAQDILDQGLKPYCRILTIANDCIVYRLPEYPGEEDEWDVDRVLKILPQVDLTD